VKTAVFLFVIFIPSSINALDVYVAPLLYVDETAENNRDAVQLQSDLLGALWVVETGVMLQFSQLKDNRINPPESRLDALTVCRNEQINYLLYGYVAKKAHNLQAEIRLFDYENRVVIQSFYASDTHENYNRLIGDIARKILDYIDKTFKLDIKIEKTAVTRLEMPVFISYWTPMDSNWAEVMLGTVNTGGGLMFIPTDSLFTIKGKTFFLAAGLEIKYRLGIGNPASYESFNNTFYFTIPVQINMALNERHRLFIGLGYTYFLEIFSITDKYEDSKTHIYNNMGMYTCFGYMFAINKTLALLFRCDFDFLLNEHPLITYSPTLGVIIQVYGKEITKKW
jgi:hypothetical protein